jgi:hypothetical protein
VTPGPPGLPRSCPPGIRGASSCSCASGPRCLLSGASRCTATARTRPGGPRGSSLRPPARGRRRSRSPARPRRRAPRSRGRP